MITEKTQKTPKNNIKSRQNRKKYSADHWQWTLLSLPALIFFLIFSYIPMFGVIIAFKDYKYHEGIFGSKWVGFKNFEFFFKSQDAERIIRNTLGYGVLFVILGIVTAAILALILFEVRKKLAIKYYQTTFILPNFMSWVIVGYITYALFNPELGIFNQILKSMGASPIQWYSEPKYWPVILTVTHVWKVVGMNSIYYYAALMGVDKSLYEAAIVDGANKFQQVIHISVPSLVPMMIILGIMSIGGIIRGDFGLFYQIPRNIGLLYPTTDIIDTYVYRGLSTGNLSATTAVGLFQSVVGLILVITANQIVKKVSPENAMF